MHMVRAQFAKFAPSFLPLHHRGLDAVVVVNGSINASTSCFTAFIMTP